MKSLVIGMGIGQLYKTVLEKLGHEVVTVDSDIGKGATFPSIDPAILLHGYFDTVHICTPNFTHFELAAKVARVSGIVFVEKPGVVNSTMWKKLVTAFPKTRFMMVKNNMWRTNILELKELASRAKKVNIEWTRRNCIPSPGSWFTTRELAFGGVSRDLMPHLLSLYIALNPRWSEEQVNGQSALQQWQLFEIESTEYGTVNPEGTHNVDDLCTMNFGDKWQLKTNWRSMDYENSAIEFLMQDNSVERFELGWCPEEAYTNMIADAVKNLNNNNYWNQQLIYDSWIHERIETL